MAPADARARQPHRHGSLNLADVVSPAVRSRIMAGIRSADTGPEMFLRRGLHSLGWRYRLHRRDLPGRPDLVFPSRRAVIFANGCFWHGHNCHLFKWPKSHEEFWRTKIAGNIARDRRVRDQLGAAAWRIADVWECTIKGRWRLPPEELIAACDAFLRSEESSISVGRDQIVTVPDVA